MIFLAGFIFLIGFIYAQATNGHNRFYAELQYGPFFILGVSIYFFNHNIYKNCPLFMIFGSSIACFYYFMTTGSGSYTGLNFFDPIQIRTALSFAVLSLIFFMLCRRTVGGCFLQFDKILGDLTYPFYLIHYLVISFFIWWSNVQGLIGLLGIFAVCILVSLFAHKLIEQPLASSRNKLRRKHLYNVPLNRL